MDLDTKTPPYKTSDKNSFAYISARDRWPIILTGAIDDIHRAILSCSTDDATKTQEGKTILSQISTLKYEIQHDRALEPLQDDGGKDIASYNEELEALRGGGSNKVTWMNAAWLFVECYLYRRLHTFFKRSQHWKNYDVFAAQKISTFKSSRPAVLELAAKYKDLITKLQENKSKNHLIADSQAGSAAATPSAEEADAQKLLFIEMCEICLWGNATDLSLLTSLSYDDIQALQGSSARKAAENKILVNDLPAAYDSLEHSQSTKGEKNNGERIVHIILDNAGFELFVDLVLAGYLIESGLATRVVLEGKAMPWFVSDVIPTDFGHLIDALRHPHAFFSTTPNDAASNEQPPPSVLSDDEISTLNFLAEHLTTLHTSSALTLRCSPFWTTPASYWRLPTLAPSLHDDLCASELVIFKGDLNYRKLVGDAMWDPTTSFAEAIGPLGRKAGEGKGVKVLALRTCKADTVVGLPAGKDEELRGVEEGGDDGDEKEEERKKRKWAWSGRWAVIQFWDGKK